MRRFFAMVWYNLGIQVMICGAKVASLWNPKAKKWINGRKHLMQKIRESITANDRIVWVHASSLGEFEQGRPIMEAIRATHPEYKIMLTFFSPSGYEIRKNYAGADFVFYLPFDAPHSVKEFMRVVRPEIAIFIKYEFWLNFLDALRHSNCHTLLVSAIFRKNSVFFRPWGGAFRRALKTYDTLFVQNEESKQLLASIGINNVVIAGDTRFDRVAKLAEAAPKLDTIASFRDGKRMFVAGSTWGPDEELLIPLINAHPDTKFIIAPHEMDRHRIEHLMCSVKGGAVRYTESDGADFDKYQVMIIDTIGILSGVYRYADFGYIGGGFGAGIHNTLEPATFGIPLAFGPKYKKFKEAVDLITVGAAQNISDYRSLDEWFSALEHDESLRASKGAAAKEYITSHEGATEQILKALFKD